MSPLKNRGAMRNNQKKIQDPLEQGYIDACQFKKL